MSLNTSKSDLTKISNNTDALLVGKHIRSPGICKVHKSKKKMSSNKLSFIIGGSMVKDVDGYLLTGSLSSKLFLKCDLFYRWNHRIYDIILNPRKTTSVLIFTFYTLDQTTSHWAVNLNKLQNMFLSNTVIVSNIVPGGDTSKEKAEKAAQIINKACVQRIIAAANHTNK